MIHTLHIIAFLFFALSHVALASPIAPLDKRVGPSGTLNYPNDGAYLLSIGGRGQIAISYTQVHQSNAQTVGIDLTLEPLNGNPKPEVVIARGLAANPAQAITGNFATLGDKCGYYRVVVTEHQIYNGAAISFRAAAPDMYIDCVPL